MIMAKAKQVNTEMLKAIKSEEKRFRSMIKKLKLAQKTKAR